MYYNKESYNYIKNIMQSDIKYGNYTFDNRNPNLLID